MSVPPNTLLRDVKEIFEDWKESSVCLEVKTSLVDIYRKALGIEVKSISVYEKYATSAVTSQKKVFLRIAAEEKGHKCIMENIIEFLTRPESWVENAEFSHLDEDYYL